jgi:hypothetical protein
MIVRAQDRTDLELAIERATVVAVAAMERWSRTVRALPLRVRSNELCLALRGLSAWYERLCVDDQYAMSGPADGIEALHRITHLTTELPTQEMLTAWWAVRVAEEVAECRRLVASSDDADGIGLEVAMSRLEVAVYGGHERMSQGSLVAVNEATRPAQDELLSVFPPIRAS